ncbi:MAG: Do family serine endopeptidase [Acidobacteria bacterium]|nr:Do family serine endopeptidase [Acidobacteriota bacterium]
MNGMFGRFTLGQRARAAMAAAAAAVLIAGAAWYGGGAHAQSTRLATVSTPIAHAIAGGRDSYADIVDVASPAVVTIRTDGKARMSPTQFQGPDNDFFEQFFGGRFGNGRGDGRGNGSRPRQIPRQRALGSGVIVTTDGYVLTNHHVVDGAETINVDLVDGRTLTAKLIGSDKPSDLALLKIPGHDFKALALGDSDAVRVGDVVLAVGNPLNIGQTVTMGIISAKGRSTAGPGDGSYEDFLQTDAPINHGNSGGALVNMKGELVGINSQILSNGGDGNIGIGFSIPVNMAKNVMEQLRAKGKVTRAQLGVTVQGVTSDIAQSLGLKGTTGALVSNVTPGSAADHAGVKRGDVIESFNGQAVHDTNSLRNRVAAAGPGSKADLHIMRDGSERHVTATLDEAGMPERIARAENSGAGSDDKTALGVSVAPLTPDVAARMRAPRDAHGLVVQDVDPDGRAASAGIQSGDIIQEVNRQPVKSVEDLRAAVKKSNDRPTLMLINRQGQDVFVTVKPVNG